MPSAAASSSIVVALLGNPNTGKSTLFNALAGLRQRVANYPGVTVEKKTGGFEHQGRRYLLVDLPGLRSLSPQSRDEMVAVDVLLGRQPGIPPVDVVLCILDASNLWRHLYLASQVLELGLPVVLAVNMLDIARAQHLEIDFPSLSAKLGVPVVPMQANKSIGIEEIKAALEAAIAEPPGGSGSPLPAVVDEQTSWLADRFSQADAPAVRRLPAYLIRRLLLDVGGYVEQTLIRENGQSLATALETARQRLHQAGFSPPRAEVAARDAWIRSVLQGVVREPSQRPKTWTDRIDGVLTHRVWGTAFFAVVMLLLFQAVFHGARPFTQLLDAGVGIAAQAVEAGLGEGPLRSLLIDGVIGGVGSLLTFLPQILILFLFIGVLEDCGYMGRAAFLMDRWMIRVGLSGKSFIPLLCSFACGVPGIMATRVIEDHRDRLATILVAPLITCSARIPVFVLMISLFVPADVALLGGWLGLQGLTLAGMYVLGIVTAVLAALVFKRTVLRGETPPFVMELPSYKWPSAKNVLFRMTERGLVFVRAAGTIILAVSVLVWAGLYYPHRPQALENDVQVQQLRQRLAQSAAQGEPSAEQLRQLSLAETAAYQRDSYLGRFGHVVEPVFRPLGWDWRISCAVIAAFPAREVVVATMGVIFNLGEQLDVHSPEGVLRLRARLDEVRWPTTGRPVFSLPVALSIIVFFALCAQCAATLAVIRRETNSWRWPLFTFAYMTVLAYLGALATYQTGTWISGAL